MGSRETLEVLEYRARMLQEQIDRCERGLANPDVSDEALDKMRADLTDYDRYIMEFRLDDDDD